ncbi:hypothetical protein QYE77_04735 [Thermanaerothrix sp. 4228-RoL]|uniref:Uncharacterized protein n=1 Tax=Thermanaerothrix solaris TaxID=3058434 RepID=A0ABU3NL36_9CHLR|nr:hypothetical protein [Thermanaerothrix sp. 4228-RoL]MDT8897563.1 hypothetical protein [Thermanaerothrix sp. 4228-RoL]
MTQQLPLPPSEKPTSQPSESKRFTGIIIGIIILLILVIAGITLLAIAPAETTARVRDIFIIVLALESLLLGIALIILIVQLAILINLLQNEVKPILEATQETINNLRGTTVFLSNNLVEPVIKLNEYLAGLKKILDLLRFGR